jgi:hypothetical protein
MLVHPGSIAKAAQDAGMAVPSDLDSYNQEAYPHWDVYCKVQLGVPVTWGNHWRNAKIITDIPLDRIRDVTLQDLEALGFAP